jgi:betaine-aldehyde dehydrogenase
VEKLKMFINGEWTGAKSGKTYGIINPATEEVFAEAPFGSFEDARAAIDAARTTFDSGIWSEKAPMERAAFLWKLADIVEKDTDRLARILSMDVGKTLKYARYSDIPFIVDNLRYFAGAARMLEGKASAEYSGIGTSIIRREPLGVVAAIAPWNYPLYIETWKFAPALAAGNTVVIKPASYTPMAILEIVKHASKLLPRGVLNVVTGPGETVGAELASNAKVDKIAFTGDVSSGKQIMQLAAKNVKEVELELGGKAPFVVLKDADIGAATEAAVVGGFWNTAQDCTAATRIYVHKSIHQKFVKMLIAKAKKIKVGNPLESDTDMGPLISERQLERVESYVKSGIKQGAKLQIGGKRPAHLKKGYYFEPTIFTDVEQDMKICQEEIFGPLLSVLKFDTEDEAIEKSNDTIYGLAASVWGKDITSTMKVARKLDFGTVWINEHGILVSEMPHGGFKQSGFGKDLSMYSFDDYTKIKHIYIDNTGLVRKPWYWVVYGKKE